MSPSKDEFTFTFDRRSPGVFKFVPFISLPGGHKKSMLQATLTLYCTTLSTVVSTDPSFSSKVQTFDSVPVGDVVVNSYYFKVPTFINTNDANCPIMSKVAYLLPDGTNLAIPGLSSTISQIPNFSRIIRTQPEFGFQITEFKTVRE